MNLFCSSCHDIIRGVPDGTILGPCFNILANDLFFLIRKCEVCYFADNNTLYSVGKNIENLIQGWKGILLVWWSGSKLTQ